MTLFTRRIVYISLIIFFLIITPLILFYSMGYSFDWQKKKLTQTGGFYFKSYPSNAKIYINDKANNKTPRLISRLLPKEYTVRISKDGFYPWEKQLKIESKIITEARNILLVPENSQANIVEENLSLGFSLNSYFLKEEEAKKLNQAKAAANERIKADSYVFAGDIIYYLQPSDYLLYRSNLNGNSKEQIALSPLPPDIYKINISPARNFSSALSRSGRLYLLDAEKRIFNLIEIGVKNAHFSPDNKKLLFHTDSELWVIYLEKIQIQPYHKAGEKELITRFSEKINSAAWYPEDNEHIIFIIGNTIKITELDGRDKRNAYDFLKAGQNFQSDAWDNPQLYYNSKKELLYFINNSKLYSAQIKAPQSIIEATGLFNYGK